MTRLHTKLMLAFSLVVVFIVAVMLASLWKVAASSFADHLRTDMARSYRPFENLQRPLLKQLVDRTSQIASDPTVQEARIRHDTGNLKDLIEEIGRDSRLDLVVLTDLHGKVLVEYRHPASTATAVSDLSRLPLVQSVLRDGAAVSSYLTYSDHNLYSAAVGPLTKGEFTDGVVLLGRRVDESFCRLISESLSVKDTLVMTAAGGRTVVGFDPLTSGQPETDLSDSMNTFLADWHPPAVEPPWKTQARSEIKPIEIRLSDRPYLALPYPLWDAVTEKPAGWVFMMKPLDELLLLVRRLVYFVLAVGVTAMLMALFISLLVSGRITHPIEALAEKMRLVGEGDLDQQATVSGKDEVARLSASFNDMTAGLRQKELLKRYVPLGARDAIEQGQGKITLGGIRLSASVMFSDLRGFTTLSEKVDPTEVVELLNEYLQCMIGIIHHNGGDINDYIGDAILAVFHDEAAATSAHQAVKAAVQMQQGLDDLRRKTGNPHLQTLRMGIGIHTGVLVEGNVGTAERLKHAVIGDTVNSAARIQDRSRDGKHTCILLSEATYHVIHQDVVAEFFGNEHLKGKAEPVRIWEVVHLKSALVD